MSGRGKPRSIARTAATGGALDAAFLRWSTSLPVDRRLLEVDCAGSIAHVEGLRTAGLLTADEAATLTAALRGLPAKVATGEVELPDEEDVHMAVEAWLSEEVGAVSGKLHTGRSRNDQVATDLKLWCREAVDRLRAAIAGVLEGIDGWSETHGEVPMPAYTHRQVAVPTLGGVWVAGALGEGLRRDAALLSAVDAELRESPLGAGAVGGTTLPIDPAVTAAALGFASGPRNPIDAVGDRDHALTLLFTCARIGIHLSRWSTDVIELSSDGLITVGGAIAGGSSMMPHKRNPDLFELLRGLAPIRQGELIAVMGMTTGLGSGYQRDLQHDKEILFRAVDGTVDALRMAGLGLLHIALVPEACRRALETGDAIATDLCEALVAEGIAFRDAYAKVGALVVQCRSAGRRLTDLDDAALSSAGFGASARAVLDVARSARRRAGRES